MESLLPVSMFIVVLVLVELGYFVLKALRPPERKEVRARLKALASQSEGEGSVDILKKHRLSEIAWLHRLLNKFASAGILMHLVEQAGVPHTPGFYLLLSVTFALFGFLAGTRLQSAYFPLVPGFLVIVPCLLGLGLLPFLHLRLKRRKRYHQFEEQLPEALDLIARSLKAGHAFSSGLKLVSEEMGGPIGFEFGKTLNEVNFGVDLQDALANMTKRIPIDDLKFFVISVILQRETGGNLAEILENLARLIRERFKLYGHVRVLSAQARLSAYILTAIPFVAAIGVHMINPKFFDAFFENPTGKYILALGVVWMIIGMLVMKKLVTIRV